MANKQICSVDVVEEITQDDMVYVNTGNNIRQVKVKNTSWWKQLIDHVSAKNNPHSVTKSHIGLGNVENVSTNNQTPTYTKATSLTTLSSGEKLTLAFGKIAYAIDILINRSVYSEQEKLVGKWLDGKPIYQKTIIFQPEINVENPVIDTSALNVDKIIKIEGSMLTDGGNSYISIPAYYNNNNTAYNSVYYNVSSKQVNLRLGAQYYRYSNNVAYITLQYTKTTN